MMLLADSGSTKTEWALLDSGKRKKTIETPGLNPYFHSSGTVESVLRADLVPNVVPDFIREIHFYGAGCSTENNNNMIRDAVRVFFRKASIHIHHDILGAARALLGTGKGIACILGTGCNACYYDGKKIHSIVPSLGYLFGDEGAGSNLGKRLMESYLKDRLPSRLRKEFDAQYNLSLEDILNALYNRPFPNRFLASFSEFIAPRQQHPFLRELIRSSFHAFFTEQVEKYGDYKKLTVSFTGSIAWIYREILLEVAAGHKIRTGSIQPSPMEGLIRYHSRKRPGGGKSRSR
jgi:N-acetylglucosamine kinase-like BadF-type ATPase